MPQCGDACRERTAGSPVGALPEKRGEHQAAIGPQPVIAALDPERAEIALEAFAVIAGLGPRRARWPTPAARTKVFLLLFLQKKKILSSEI